jgi:hypothetical protein
VKEKDIKMIVAGVTVVTTMLKIIIQHRGQSRKGCQRVSSHKE